MDKKLEIFDLSAELKFINTRELDFSLRECFEMYSNPEYLKEWFGPKGFTNTFKQYDFRENGDWIFTMHGPDGTDYVNENVFLKIIKDELIVWEHLLVPNFQAQIRFTKVGEEKTKIEFSMFFYEKNVFDGVMKYAPEKNEENFDKLEALMKKVYSRK